MTTRGVLNGERMVQVLIAFVLSAAFALVTAYLSLSLQLIHFFEARHTAETFESAVDSKTIKNAVLVTLRYLYSLFRYAFCRNGVRRDGTLSQSERQRLYKFCEDFLLTLSDQQLVTGIAILVAGWINRKTSTVYQFEMVNALAWMSSDVHLLTVGQLRAFFRKNPLAKHWRAAGMFSTFVLLFVANFYRGHVDWYSNFHHPTQCLIDDVNRSASYIRGSAAENMLIWGLLLFYSYARGIIPLYYDTDKWRDRLLSLREGYLRDNRRVSYIRLALLDIFWIVSSEVFNVIIVQTFWFSYGNRSIWCDRILALSYGVLDAEDSAWGLGEIVPLFLLALPVLNSLDFFIWIHKPTSEEAVG
ncbi:hypothetical protein PV08_08365 [Exophiala spinifera]|uniref:Uncharacterized protein n=1 Tax=Exophiala spinifera TaxID=91928 RepID=A0A0D2B2M2_9EURO|nr:uncharacterized protein PV08_08365 [Exophiala spinifera]KIW13178.1 hypothetical protein PV08_08365 [Exophiala spinifera]